jgi:putative transposase
MNTPIPTNRYKHHRFPAKIISHGVWLYYRFSLTYRDVEELLFARGIIVTYEAIRKWCLKFGQAYANQLRRRRPTPGDKGHLDEVFLTIKGESHYLWRAVDQDGNILDILVQRRRDKHAAKTFFRKLLKGLAYVPRVIITDKLKSYGAAKGEILPGVEHRQHRYLNNRAENSHQPTRQRERRMQGLAYAGVQVGRAGAAVPRRVWSHRPTLAATTINVVDPAFLVAKGEGAFVSVQVTCDLAPNSGVFVNVDLFQRAGNSAIVGSGSTNIRPHNLRQYAPDHRRDRNELQPSI